MAALLVGCGVAGRPIEDDYRAAEHELNHGNLDRAFERASRGLERAGSDADRRWKFRLLAADILLNQRKADQAARMLTGESALVPAELAGMYKVLLADSYRRVSRTDEARSLLDEARRDSLVRNDRRLALEVKQHEFYIAPGNDEKVRVLQEVLADATSQGNRRIETLALIDLGHLRALRSRFDEALPYWIRAEKVAAAGGYHRLRGLALGNIGYCQLNLGESDQAIVNLREAERLSRQAGDKLRTGIWVNNIGNWHYRRGEYSESRERFQAAAELVREAGDAEWQARTLANIAEAATKADDLSTAESALRRVLAIIRPMPADQKIVTFSRFIAGRVAAQRREDGEAEKAFREAVAMATEHNHPSLLWSAHRELAQLYARAGKAAQADAEFRASLSIVDSQWEGLNDNVQRVGFLSSLIELYQAYVDFLVTQGNSDRALEVAESSRARVLARRLDQRLSPSIQAAPSAARLRALAAESNTILLSFWTAPARSFLWVVAPGGITRFDLPPRDQIATLAARYNAAVTAGHDPIERGNPYGAELFRTLLGEASAKIPRGATVVAAVDGGLHRVNLETLVVPTPKPHYWIQDVTVAVAPSLTGLERAAIPRLDRDASLLFIGDPVPPDPRYPALMYLGREREVVESHFAAGRRTVYTRAEAQPAVYRQAEPGRFSHLHFAAHAVPNDEQPLYSSVILSSNQGFYRLYAQDVLDRPLKASLVMLSACHGAGTRAYSGEGLLGFSWAFLSSGARNVVAGLWQVDDEATVELVRRFYDGLAAGKAPPAALRAAKLGLLSSGNRASHAPYFWGSFQLFTRDVWPLSPSPKPAAVARVSGQAPVEYAR